MHTLAKCYRQTTLSIVHKRAKPYQLALHKTAKRDKHTKEHKRKRVKPYERALHKQAKCYRQTILSIVHKRAKPYQLALHKMAKRDKHTQEQKRKRVKPYQMALHKLAKCYRQTILSIVHERAKPYQLALHKTTKHDKHTKEQKRKRVKPYQLALHKTAKRDMHTKEQKRKRVKPYQLALHKLAKCYSQTMLSIIHKGPSLTNWLCTKRPSMISTQKSRKETGFAQTGQVLQANNTINSAQKGQALPTGFAQNGQA